MPTFWLETSVGTFSLPGGAYVEVLAEVVDVEWTRHDHSSRISWSPLCCHIRWMGELLCTGAMPASRGIPECKSIHENGNAEGWFPAAACLSDRQMGGTGMVFFYKL